MMLFQSPLLILCVLSAQETGTPALDFAVSSVTLEHLGARIVLADVDGDGDDDLLVTGSQGIDVHSQSEKGLFAPTPDRRVNWPADEMAWTLVDVDGDGITELVTYRDARHLESHSLVPGTEEKRVLDLEFAGNVPRGRFHMEFLRNIDGDGRVDLVLPAFGHFAILLQAADGTFASPLEVHLETDVSVQVGDPRELNSRFEQEVRIPWFELRDIDGDGDADLVAETENEVRFHLAAPEIESDPSWTLDLDALRAELPPSGGIDFDNLLGEAAREVRWRLADLDGHVPDELIVQIGRKFRVYDGGSRTGPIGAPSQVLKSSGNVLYFTIRDVLGDGHADLQIMRGERLSLARVIRWLVLPGNLDFDIFTYRNDGGRFSSRPARRNTVVLEIPRLLKFLGASGGPRIGAEPVPTRRVALDFDGEENDVLDVLDRQLVIWRDLAGTGEISRASESEGADSLSHAFLEQHVDGLADGESKSFDLEQAENWSLAAGPKLRAVASETDADLRLPLFPDLEDARIETLDVNGDDRQDVLVLGRRPEEDDSPGRWILQFFVQIGAR